MTARILLFAVVVALTGCGSDDTGGSEPAADATTISLTDFALEPSEVSIDSAGTATFRVVNDGQTDHALEIEGGGLEEETDLLGPGESAELTVDLEQGEYELYCPVGNHREQGMEGALAVGSAAAGSTSGDEDDGQDSGYYP